MTEMFAKFHEDNSTIVNISEDEILETCESSIIKELRSWDWIFAKGPRFELQLRNGLHAFIEEGRVISSNNKDIVGEKFTSRFLTNLLA